MSGTTAASPDAQAEAYRHFQSAVVPGADGLYRQVRAILDDVLPDRASIILAGAGGGREVETLGNSSRGYRLIAVDPSAEMLAIAQARADAIGIADRVRFVEGLVEDLPTDPCDAATSLFVMHFVPADGKPRYLEAIRRRLRPRAPYLHVDVCFDRDGYRRLAPVYARHAELGGLAADAAAAVAARVGDMPVVAEAAMIDLFGQAGFRPVAPFFRGLWYAGWWLEAA
jgi:tRNA (cmo5U34)-methyltransferase